MEPLYTSSRVTLIPGTAVPVWWIDWQRDCDVPLKDIQWMYRLTDEQLQWALVYASEHPEEMAEEIDYQYSNIWQPDGDGEIRTHGASWKNLL